MADTTDTESTSALGTILGLIIFIVIVIGIFYAVRWAYRKFWKKDKVKFTVTDSDEPVGKQI